MLSMSAIRVTRSVTACYKGSSTVTMIPRSQNLLYIVLFNIPVPKECLIKVCVA